MIPQDPAPSRARTFIAALRWPRLTTPLLGTVTLATLVALGVVGVVMSLRYAPSTSAAHEASATMGLLRDVHAWLATLLLVLVVIHAGRGFVHSGPPARRWLSGMAALGVLGFAFFTGTVLPWDQQGWEALQHSEDAAGTVGTTWIDAEDPSAAPLRAVFYLHVFVPPLLIAGLLAVHLRRRGSSAFHRLAAYGRVAAPPIAFLFLLVLLLALAVPAEHGPKPIQGVTAAKPDWPFLWLVPIQDLLGPLGLWALPIAGVTAASLPWLVRSWKPAARWGLLVGAAVVFVAMSIMGAVS